MGYKIWEKILLKNTLGMPLDLRDMTLIYSLNDSGLKTPKSHFTLLSGGLIEPWLPKG